jgi:uncharacterized protein (TIGR00255 family)
MIRSMTGYAAVEETDGQLFAGIEMRSYNSRHLDIALRISSGYLLLEESIKNLIAQKLTRGRVEINVRVKDESEAATRFEVHMQRAKAYYQALCRIRDELGLNDSPSLDHLLRAGDMVSPADLDERAAKNTWPLVERCLNKAMSNLNRMRKTEGDFISRDFSNRLDAIGAWLEQIKAQTEGLLPVYRDRLKERINNLTCGIVEIDPARIAQEAAFLADKSDISEEITRAKSHFEQFRKEMDSDEPAGRKLNFLLQEFNREFNTMGSKSGNREVSYLIVNVKTELEKIREQVQNIE